MTWLVNPRRRSRLRFNLDLAKYPGQELARWTETKAAPAASEPSPTFSHFPQSGLVGTLFSLMGLGFGAGLLGLGLLGGHIALSLRLVLLRSSLAPQLIFPGYCPSRFLRLALYVFDNAFHPSFGTGVLVLTHSSLSLVCRHGCLSSRYVCPNSEL
jgi:hypothetical protein